LKFWWKKLPQQVRPIQETDWKAFKSIGILKPMRGCRAGRKREHTNNTCEVNIISPKFSNVDAKSSNILAYNSTLLNIQEIKVQTSSMNNNDKLVSSYGNSCDNDVDTGTIPVIISHRSNSVLSERQQRTLVNIKTTNTCNSRPSLLGLWNCRSIKNKIATICDCIINDKLDIFVLTETWLSDSIQDSTILDGFLPDYNFLHKPRAQRGGGVGVVLRKGYETRELVSNRYSSFEHLDLAISSGSTHLHLVSIYRPPPS